MTRSVAKTCEEVVTAIAEHSLDVPFALLYLRDPDGKGFTRHGVIGLEENAAACPLRVELKDGEPVWPLARAAEGETVLVEDVERRVTLTGGPFKDPVRAAVVMPVAAAGQSASLGVLVTGLSPNRALDEGYRSFLELLVGRCRWPCAMPAPTRRSVGAWRPWRSSIAPRRPSSATSAMSSARP
ncbi:GAF domain-containing protein [Cystobacter fuscus]